MCVALCVCVCVLTRVHLHVCAACVCLCICVCVCLCVHVCFERVSVTLINAFSNVIMLHVFPFFFPRKDFFVWLMYPVWFGGVCESKRLSVIVFVCVYQCNMYGHIDTCVVFIVKILL